MHSWNADCLPHLLLPLLFDAILVNLTHVDQTPSVEP